MQSLRSETIELSTVRATTDARSLTLESVEETASLHLDVDEVVELFRFLTRVMSPTDRRESHRVPIPEAGGFRATIHMPTESMTAEAKNLSLTGILLHPSNPEAAELTLGARVRLALEFDRESVTLDAIVRRETETEYGLSFLNHGTRDEADPLHALSRIILKLERHWIMEAWKP